MYTYRAPLRDIRFVVHDVLDFERKLPRLRARRPEPRAARGHPRGRRTLRRRRAGPHQPRRRRPRPASSRTARSRPRPGFKEAYDRYCQDGWITMTADPAVGRPGPAGRFLAGFRRDAGARATWPGACTRGSPRARRSRSRPTAATTLKRTYLPKMIAGDWSGTMCLTEAHSGTDLGILKTRAEPRADGSYAITGTKIFISAGEHDLTQNIVHLVLARTAGRARGHPWHQPVRRAEVPARRERRCRVSATASCAARSSTRWASTRRRRA